MRNSINYYYCKGGIIYASNKVSIAHQMKPRATCKLVCLRQGTA